MPVFCTLDPRFIDCLKFCYAVGTYLFLHMRSRKPHVAVVFGGDSPNRDLSAETGYWACQYIPRNRYQVTPVQVTAAGHWQVPLGSLPVSGSVRPVLRELFRAVPAVPPADGLARLLGRQVDVLFTVLRGRGGDDGTMHALGTLLGIPVAGPTPSACHETCNKATCAERLRDVISSPAAIRAGADADVLVEEVRASFVPPLFIKPAVSEGSAGIEEVTTFDELSAAISRAKSIDSALVQPRSRGQEVAVSVFRGPRGKVHVLPPTVIVPRQARYYDHMAKRRGGRVSLLTSRPEKNELLNEVEDIAHEVFTELGGEGLLTLDLAIGPKSTELLEVNSVPTATELTPLLHQLRAGGTSPAHLLDTLLARALERGPL
ncbi:MAG: hypothetical protein COT71_01635 [Candidatus Andersenbacteria bacterium CG10_big_fil_rev_8_21_14_0_10_54_11]|uniref:ATP-grasp domain-containing protein n=1 Tax=Candidatus Andersenbacteria bacterium CG10_big_fil_rev_8_21_14_0_10_54_11 TaxID=1974485 RepID=A0A2M6WZR9_9BACT|nr:MAG: hypothetical protein COT71_01635 [Candidatus Andersenbacteria bacterium CG10_big_fil_rev_8_21_14_0_10_54_11]